MFLMQPQSAGGGEGVVLDVQDGDGAGPLRWCWGGMSKRAARAGHLK